jgi:hypothetical protein
MITTTPARQQNYVVRHGECQAGGDAPLPLRMNGERR